MLDIHWSQNALDDLVRLHAFLADFIEKTAHRAVRLLSSTPHRLVRHPRLGRRLEEFAPREVRQLFVGAYELRYENREQTIEIVRIWHTREDRREP